MSIKPPLEPQEVIDRATHCGKCREGVLTLATYLSGLHADLLIATALDAMDPYAATLLALAYGTLGEKLSPQVLALVLDRTDEVELLGLLLMQLSEDVGLTALSVLNADQLGAERDAVFALCAFHATPGSRRDLRLRRFLRRIERALPSDSPNASFITAALDAWRKGEGGDPPEPPWMASARGPLLDALPSASETNLLRGFTLRREEAKLGRNDPCHCGSGKKYKKCCAGKADRPPQITFGSGLTARHFEPGRAHLISDEQFATMRAHALAQLEPKELSTRRLISGVHTLTFFHRWDSAERWTAELAAREDGGNDWWEDLALAALSGGDLALAGRCRDKCQRQDAREELDLRLLIARKDAPALAELDKAAYGDLSSNRSDNTAAVAFSLLEHYPALGVIFARGCLDPKRQFDSEVLLESISDARAEIDLDPEDLGETMWRALVEATEIERINERSEQQAATIRALHEREQSSSRELQALREQLPSLQTRLDQAQSAAGNAPAELQRQRERIEELKGLIREGSAERLSLREELRRAHSGAPAPDATELGAASLAEVTEHEEQHDVDTTPLRQPRISAAQVRELSALGGELGKRCLIRLGELAGGLTSAWHQTKRLRVAGGLLSSRVGIHHRLLFKVGPEELEFVDLIHRRDLERYLG